MSAAEAIIAEVDALQPELRVALADAVAIPSVNPKYPGEDPADHLGHETRVARLVADVYRAAGAETELRAVEPGRENAMGTIAGAGGGRSLLFNGHIDVVPGGAASDWDIGAPFDPHVDDDGRMWGRGTADMKAGVLAQAFAAVALRRAGIRLDGDLLLQAVVGEEVGDHEAGTSGAVASGHRAAMAVVAEPSGARGELHVMPVTAGLLWCSVTVRGKAVHSGLRGATVHPTSSGAALGVNAIDKLFLVYAAMRALEDEWAATRRHPLFPPGHFSMLPGLVTGGPGTLQTPFFHADAATLHYAVNFHPGSSCEDVEIELRERLSLAAAGDLWLREHPPELTVHFRWPASWLEPGHEICTAVSRAHTGATRRQVAFAGFPGVADSTWLQAAGIPAVIYGPGDLRVAHSYHEHVHLADVALACRTYALLAADWCGAQP